ncbi:MAG: YebC/PmpR family DNA-binding transcriptional regulator [Anaerolineales bacterium]|nr:YebC/PmpR family DNA-binding transcriptional regulator [Anaerolineales bacterium]MCB0005178.1 YebC/PmpR family DNA-binding transcriptional regulator [Anaerolineales bacterium]MCB0014585.1 YebC/PmpR family DNA-binding transcriptional regulator [Anaerolineales bacterium]MCB0020380.1 YebC/PmpR family DNA-binding transcriptional regulator [Anaerolineales bacterium]MCB8958770.1 YebC/PmpR family DNA-binding transcriptional regulator [Ardenticatenales bacterium]
MSGHSKWSTIKHKKAAADAKRGKLFTRVAKELTIAAKEGGGDSATNPRLRLAIDKARAANMPKDNIERAIQRGTGEIEGLEYSEIMYEAYAPNGIGILIEVVTDNKNRSLADIRSALNKNGGSLASAGSVSWQFTRKGYVEVQGDVDQDELFLLAADAGADDVDFSGEVTGVYSDPNNMSEVRNLLEENGFDLSEAKLIYEPNNTTSLGVQDSLQVLRVIERVEELDDVENVYSTLELTDEAMAAMESEE